MPLQRVDTAALPGRVALVLQGGGALGAYQVGAYQALDEAGYAPEWFAGTSIGAINAAIMAGNPRESRLAKLDEFWATICRPMPLAAPMQDLPRRIFNAWSAWQTMALGQPGFFRWNPVSPWLAPPGTNPAISFYDTRELRRTLEQVVDLDRINHGDIRLSLGAVEIESGQQVYFDSSKQMIGYQHIMASGALPPAFPPIEVEGAWYWDGGIVSNTPLDVIIDQLPRRSTLCFMVDLFDSAGPFPRVMEDVDARRKDIMYASRSDRSIEAHRKMHNLRRAIMALWDRLPPEAQKDPHLGELGNLGCVTTMHIVHLVHRSEADELASKDYEFSADSVREHKETGYRDALAMLANPTWLAPTPPDIGVVVHQARRAAEAAEADQHARSAS
jgi:NTE family protein